MSSLQGSSVSLELSEAWTTEPVMDDARLERVLRAFSLEGDDIVLLRSFHRRVRDGKRDAMPGDSPDLRRRERGLDSASSSNSYDGVWARLVVLLELVLVE